MTSSGNIIHASRIHSIISFHYRGELNKERDLFATSSCKWGLNGDSTVPNFCGALIFLNFSHFEPRIVFKILLYYRRNIPIFVDTLLHFKTKQDFVFCIDIAKVYLKAAL